MSCKNCSDINYELKVQIQNWINAGYDYNKVAAILGCNYFLVVDVAQNGIGEKPVIEYETQTTETGTITTIKGSTFIDENTMQSPSVMTDEE